MQIDLTIAKKIAWKFHRSTGVELEELFGEACLAYVKALSCYNPKRAALDTWVYACMKHQLIDFCRMQKLSPPVKLPDNLAAPTIRDNLHIDQLGRDAQTIYQMLVDSPKDFYNLSPRVAKNEIRHRLRNLDWPWQRIINAFREIKGGV